MNVPCWAEHQHRSLEERDQHRLQTGRTWERNPAADVDCDHATLTTHQHNQRVQLDFSDWHIHMTCMPTYRMFGSRMWLAQTQLAHLPAQHRLSYHFKVQQCQAVTLKSVKCHPGLAYIINFGHSGTLELRSECQSARMSEIKNVG